MKTTLIVASVVQISLVIFALSDDIWKMMIPAVQTVLLAIIAPFAAWSIVTLNKIAKSSEKSHDLANSFMLAQKKKLSDTTARLAEVEKTPANIESARIELAAYMAHKETDERMKLEDK